MEKDQKRNTHSEILFRDNLHAVGKIDFVKGKKPDVDCILCAIRENDPRVTSLLLYQDENFFVCLNLYPYNPGHLMIIPAKHVERFEDLTQRERTLLFEATIQLKKLIRKKMSPTGFNVGYNEGQYSGASIQHVHIHVVPRYRNELGFIDIISQTKIIIQNSSKVLGLLKPEINKYIKKIYAKK